MAESRGEGAAGADALAEDPQIKGILGLAEGLGLGGIDPDLRQKSLRMGAATREAMGQARDAFEREISRLALPVGGDRDRAP